MAEENQIRVVITGVASDLRRALEGAKGDLGGLKAAIKDVPNQIKVDVQAETAAAAARLRELKAIAKDVPNRISIQADADTGIATAKLRLLKAEARDTENAIARAQLGSLLTSGGGGGGGLIPGAGVLANPFGAGAAPSAATGLIAGAPAIAGVAGAATAVVGSAGAGLLGAGAVGTSLLGTLGVGLGSIAAVAAPAISGIKDVTTAMDALEKAQTDYGASSKQAQQAQANLNGVIADAGPLAAAIAKQLGELGDLWQQVSKPAQHALQEIIVPALNVVKDLMPTVADVAKTALDAIGKALQPVFAGLSSPAFKKVILDLGDAFAKLAAPGIDAFANLMRAFFNVAIAASPFLIQIADAFDRWTKSFADSLAPGDRLNGLIGGLVGQLKSWWDLAKSLGGLMVTIFSAGAGTGQSLVNLLTGIVNQWNAWLNTKSGQEALTTFFRNSADLVKSLVSALAPLIGALVKLAIDLMPTFTLVIKAITPVFNLVAAAINEVADALGSKLVQAVAIAAIVFLPGGPIILGLTALGLILSHLPQILTDLKNGWQIVWDAMKIAFDKSLAFILGGFSSLLGAIKSVVDSANIKIPGIGHLFGDLGTSTSKHLGDAQTAIDKYRQTLDQAATDAKTNMDQISSSTEDMGHRVDTAVTKMTQSVQTGIVTTDSDLGKEMKKLGVTVQQVLIGASSHPLQPKPAFAGHAGGGLIQIGQAGEKGRDAIPLSVGGTDIVVGAGEQVAVFNRHQQAVMNSRLADMGGLPGMFSKHSTPHYMAQGGLVGNVSAMIAEANRVDAKHFPYVWGGGHSGFTGGPFDCSGAVSDILHAGGVLDAPRVSGDFMTYGLPGPGEVTLYANPTHVYMSIDGRFFGTSGSNPGGGAGWFPGAPRPGFAVRHVPGALDSIKQPAWNGPDGILGAIDKQDLKLATKAANQALSNALAQSFSGQTGGGDWGDSGQVAQQIFDAFSALGYDKVAIAGIIGNAVQESGLGSASRNIFQFTPAIPGSSGSIVQQAQLVAQRGGASLRTAMNAAGSPANAATIFMNMFEKPLASAANLPNRIAAAVQAFGEGYASGGLPGARRVVRARAPSKPPSTGKHTHTRTRSPHAAFVPKDALKGLLSASQLIPDHRAAGFERDATVLDQNFTNLLAAQATHAVDDPPIVTLTDADAAFFDPGDYAHLNDLQSQLAAATDPTVQGTLQTQIDQLMAGTMLEAGDQLVNKSGMVVGRFFGPGGKIQGGTFHPGVNTRLSQIAAILLNRQTRLKDLIGEKGAMHDAIGVDVAAIASREKRRKRIDAYLHKSVQRAQVVKRELDVLTSKNLAAALKSALSKQAIDGRIGDLRAHLRTVTEELAAEKADQAALIPLNRDPSHTNELEAQAQNLRDSIAVEQQLGRTGSSTVQRAKDAIYRHNLEGQLSRLELTNRNLGGQSLQVGTGGAIGKILGDIKTLGDDRDSRKNVLADLGATQIIPARAEIASYLKERTDLGKLTSVQVRTPATPTASTAAAAAGPDTASILQGLAATLTAQNAQQAALDTALLGVFQGFAPLLAGRLVGSFQSGIDFVPRTGVALVHRGETIIPDPDGPAGSRIGAATVQTAQGPVEITLTFQNNEQPLVKLVQAQMNQHALQITSDHAGQRARLLAGVRRP